MPEGLLDAYEAATTRAREQWHQDLRVARERFDAAVKQAEADYESKRKEQANVQGRIDKLNG
jgi:hypothetical protein